MEFLKNLLLLIGRIGISSLFIWAGFAKIRQWRGTVEYMKSRKIPWIGFSLPVAILVQIVGGLAVLLGYEIHFATILLIIFTIPAAVIFHDFWHFEDEMRTIEKTFFMKDMAIIGGLFLLLVSGTGAFAIQKM